MNTKKLIIQKIMLTTIALLGFTALVEKSSAQDCYGPVWIICHDSMNKTNWACCPQPFGVCGFNTTDWLISKIVIRTSTVGKVLTCGGGTAWGILDPDEFTGTCSWSESGVGCDGPYGPVPASGTVEHLRSCHGTCDGY